MPRAATSSSASCVAGSATSPAPRRRSARPRRSCGRPQAGLALVRLAQGQKAAATAIISRALEDEPWNRLARAASAAGAGADRGRVRRLRRRRPRRPPSSRRIAADFESPALLAEAASAHGRVTPGDRRPRSRRAPSCGERSSAGRTSTSPTRSRRRGSCSRRPAASPATRTAPSPRSPPRRRSSSTSAPTLDIALHRRPAQPVRPAPAASPSARPRCCASSPSGQSNKDIAATLLVERAHRRPPPVEHLHQDRRRLTLRGDRLRLRTRPQTLTRPAGAGLHCGVRDAPCAPWRTRVRARHAPAGHLYLGAPFRASRGTSCVGAPGAGQARSWIGGEEGVDVVGGRVAHDPARTAPPRSRRPRASMSSHA